MSPCISSSSQRHVGRPHLFCTLEVLLRTQHLIDCMVSQTSEFKSKLHKDQKQPEICQKQITQAIAPSKYVHDGLRAQTVVPHRNCTSKDQKQPEIRQKQITQAIAPSKCVHHGSCPQIVVPPRNCIESHVALASCSPPIEAGERCHVCDEEAECLKHGIAWCKQCACAVLLKLEITCVGTYPKEHVKRHAMDHAFLWQRFVSRLMRGYQ